MLVTASRLSQIFFNLINQKLFYGHKPSSDLVAILAVYCLHGILNSANLAITFFLKDELGLSPSEMSALLGFTALPWITKPVFGFISDGLPMWGYRRRPYLALAGLLGVFCWITLATLVHTAWIATLIITLSSLSVAVSDLIVDSLIVERAREESLTVAGSLQSLCWSAKAIGGISSSYLIGYMLACIGTRSVLGITAFLPLTVSLLALLIVEPQINERSGWSVIKQQILGLGKIFIQKSIWMPTTFLFLWQLVPTANSAFFFFMTNELGFKSEFLGRVDFVTSIAALIGVWLFQHFLQGIPFRTIFCWAAFLSLIIKMTTLLFITHINRILGIDDHWFSLGDSFILTVVEQITQMPVLVLAARLCPVGIEATMFSLLMSIKNLAHLLSQELSALLMQYLGITQTKFDNLWLLTIVVNFSIILPLIFVGFLPKLDTNTSQ